MEYLIFKFNLLNLLNFSANCSSPAVDKFPSDGLTRDQRQSGWIALHLLIAVYCFWILATICHDYLIPCIRQMCESKTPEKCPKAEQI